MNINIDSFSRVPIYLQIVREIERLVTLNILKSGEQILSIRELAISLGINPNTVKKAYDTLESKGIIVSYSTKGTYINKDIKEVKKEIIDNLIGDIKQKLKELENYGIKREEVIKLLKETEEN